MTTVIGVNNFLIVLFIKFLQAKADFNCKPLIKHVTIKIHEEIWRFEVILDVIFKMNLLDEFEQYLQNSVAWGNSYRV